MSERDVAGLRRKGEYDDRPEAGIDYSWLRQKHKDDRHSAAPRQSTQSRRQPSLPETRTGPLRSFAGSLRGPVQTDRKCPHLGDSHNMTRSPAACKYSWLATPIHSQLIADAKQTHRTINLVWPTRMSDQKHGLIFVQSLTSLPTASTPQCALLVHEIVM